MVLHALGWAVHQGCKDRSLEVGDRTLGYFVPMGMALVGAWHASPFRSRVWSGYRAATVDKPTPVTPPEPHVRRRMEAQRTRDTAPEKELRRRLHARGLRFRVDRQPIADLPRRADVLFGPSRVAVFVDGCFWHGCPKHYVPPKKNAGFWRDKIAANRTRDEETDALLRSEGWQVVRIWEHEDMEAVAERVAEIVHARR